MRNIVFEKSGAPKQNLMCLDTSVTPNFSVVALCTSEILLPYLWGSNSALVCFHAFRWLHMTGKC